MYTSSLLGEIRAEQDAIRIDRARLLQRKEYVHEDLNLANELTSFIGKTRREFRHRGDVPPTLDAIGKHILFYNDELRRREFIDHDPAYLTNIRHYNSKFYAREFSSNYIQIHGVRAGDFGKTLVRSDRFTGIFDRVFSGEGDDMPVLIDYVSNTDAAGNASQRHAILLLRKKPPRGETVVELFDPDALPEHNAVRKDINRFILNNVLDKGWRMDTNIHTRLQSEGGIQCARICWLRWYTYRYGFDGTGKDGFYNLDDFTSYFNTHFKTLKDVEKAAVATMMAEGIDDKILEDIINVHITKLGDIDEAIQRGERMEEDLARKYKSIKETHDADAEELAETEAVSLPAVEVLAPPRRHEGGGKAKAGAGEQ